MPYIGKQPANVPVTADDIPANSIDASKIIDGAITIADIADDAVTADKLANSINTAIAANTAKTGITSSQASAITANTAKTGITSSQTSAITANTAKTGITSSQASAITANTAKTGITSSQATAISAALPKAGGTMTGHIYHQDNVKGIYGGGSDLQIYHDTNHSRIADTGTGDLILSGNIVAVQNAGHSETMAKFNENGDVKLYHNDALKIATTAAGATVTGALTATSFAGSGAALTGLAAGSAGFSARATSAWNSLTNNQLIAFNNDSTGDSFDTDSCYNTSTYEFTAPATGVYMFWYGIYTAQNDVANGFGLLINDSELDFQHDAFNIISYHESTTNDHMQTATVVVPLSSGDEVSVCAMSSSDYYGAHSQWGGCRLA